MERPEGSGAPGVGRERSSRFRGAAPLVLLVVSLLVAMSAIAVADTAKEKQEARSEIQKMEKETLSRLYKAQPQAKAAIAKAAGYAVFNNFGMKIFFAGSGTGKGVAVNNATKKRTYMKMFEVQAGLGFGVQKFRLVWVFESRKDLNQFIESGWEIGAQTSAAAQASGEGTAFAGAISITPGVWLYQLTDDGLALELTAKGTKYYKDSDLN